MNEWRAPESTVIRHRRRRVEVMAGRIRPVISTGGAAGRDACVPAPRNPKPGSGAIPDVTKPAAEVEAGSRSRYAMGERFCAVREAADSRRSEGKAYAGRS